MGNEICRILFAYPRKLKNSRKIAGLYGFGKYDYVIESIDDWKKDARQSLEEYNYNLLDLFHWEQYFANWGTISLAEQDIACDELRPFNCRKFLSNYISLQDKHRFKDHPSGHVEIARVLWKELLDFPMDLPKRKIKSVLRSLHLDQIFVKTFQFVKATLGA